jgi:RNA-directed DNA polymerase
VVQGALKLILEPVFEADFQPGSYGYRPKRTAHDAIKRVAKAIVQRKTRILDIDLRAYFDNVRHDRLLEKVARRVDDADIMHLLKIMLKASGKKGVPQGGVISPLLSNLYLNEVDKMLERAREVTRSGKYIYVEYARFADDLVVLIDAYKRHDWLIGAVTNGCGRSSPSCRWKSMMKRAEQWTWDEARASASLGSTSATSAVYAE